MNLTDKKIFISAAGAGMGYSVAKMALDAGAEVYATDLKLEGLEELKSLGAKTETLDITNENLIQDYFSKSPNFNGIVNMACLLYTSPSPRDAHESRMPSSA